MPAWTDRPRRVAGVVALALALLFVGSVPVLAAEPEAVRVRFGRHADFVRVVFDWPADVPYKVELEPAGAVVRFAAPNGFDLSRLAGQPRLTASQVDAGVARLAYEGARSLKHFRHGASVVVDLYETAAGRPLPGAAPPSAAPPAAVADAEREAASKAEPPPKPAKTETPPPPPPAEPAETKTAKAEPPSPPAAVPPGEGPETPPVEAAAAAEASPAEDAPSDSAAAEPAGGAQPDALPSAARLATDAEPAPSPPAAVADAPQTQAPDSASAAPAAAETAAGPPDLASIPPEGLAPVASPRLQTGRNVAIPLWVEVDKTQVTIGLAATDARAAAFSRAGAHWIVLDRPLPIDLGIAAASGIDIVQLPFTDKTVLHIRVKDRTALSATRDGRGWRFMLAAEPEATERGEAIGILRRHAAEIGKRLALEDLPDAKLLQVVDPEVGDSLFVVTVADPRRVRTLVDLPDLRVPETALGAVIEPKTEGIGARLNSARLELRKRGGLILSNPDRILLSSTDARSSDIDPKAWRGEESYQAGLKARLAKMNGVAEFGRNGARMDLARYALARGLATEALGFLQVVALSDKGAASKQEFKAMRGIARAMLGQHDLAAVDLDDPGLSGDPHVEIWRALGLVEAGQARFASAKFRRFQDAIAEWPERHRVKLTVAAGEASLAAGLPAVAERFIQVDITPGRRLRKDQLAALAVVDAGVKVGRGELEAAEQSLEVAKRDGDPATQAKAELALVKLGYAEGKLDADAATDRLTRLQLRWRGDRVEYDTLRALGEIQLANSRYREGFKALSEAAHVFSTQFDTTDVRAAMTAGFERAFVGAEAEKMPAFEAVALFQDYEDLAPPGSTGDMALANLARRLASLDLLEEADEIMDHLVRRRLDGSKRAAMAGDLAALRLSERDWKGALQAIGQIDTETLSRYDPSRLRLSRLKAEALGGLGQIEQAMALLDGLNDRDALELKARMAWSNADWVSARAAYRELDALGVFEGEKLPAPAAAMAARWAVTATMMKNSPEVQALAERFKDRIEDPALASALTALAAPDTTDGDALDAAREAIANAEAVGKAFDAYRSARRS